MCRDGSAVCWGNSPEKERETRDGVCSVHPVATGGRSMVLRTCRRPPLARKCGRARMCAGLAVLSVPWAARAQDLGLDGRRYGHAVRGVANADLVSMALEGGDRGQDAWNEIVRRNKRAVWKVGVVIRPQPPIATRSSNAPGCGPSSGSTSCATPTASTCG